MKKFLYPLAGFAALFILFVPVRAHAAMFGQTDIPFFGHSTDPGGVTNTVLQLFTLITLLAVVPTLLVMTTAFTRIIVVLSLLRNAFGTQSTPPNIILIGLALFLTLFVMQPVFTASWHSGIYPLIQNQIGLIKGLEASADPFKKFMLENTSPSNISLFLNLGHIAKPAAAAATPWRVLVPAFVVGELSRAFQIGFLLYLPFLIIDMVVASILMSLGMMVLPPTAISLPFKLVFFVMVSGWQMVAGSLIRGFIPFH